MVWLDKVERLMAFNILIKKRRSKTFFFTKQTDIGYKKSVVVRRKPVSLRANLLRSVS